MAAQSIQQLPHLEEKASLEFRKFLDRQLIMVSFVLWPVEVRKNEGLGHDTTYWMAFT